MRRNLKLGSFATARDLVNSGRLACGWLRHRRDHFISPSPPTPSLVSAPASASDEPRVVSWLEKISYGLGDTASNLVFHMVGAYLLFFYTDVYGLPVAAVGTLFLFTRVMDAVYDMGAGILIDRTRTRWGKCRPWFLWCALPYAVFAVLTFRVPALTADGKLIYAYITYNVLSLLYTAINLPISAMLPSMTRNTHERSETSSVRMFLAVVGMSVVTYGTLPLVDFFGRGDKAKGFLWTMVLFAAVSFAFFMLTFWNTRERYQPAAHTEPTLRDSVQSMLRNWPWAITLGLNFIYWFGYAMRMQTTVYYVRYNLHRPDLIPTVMLTNLASLPGIAAGAWLSRRIGKRNTMLLGLAGMATGIGVIALAESGGLAWLIGGNLIANFSKGLYIGLLFALMADTVDYGEWKTGIRAAGFLFAAATLGVKLGLGLGGAFSAWTLSAAGYVPNADQSAAALAIIRANYIVVPAICTSLMVGLLLFYRLDRQHAQIMRELDARRKAAAA